MDFVKMTISIEPERPSVIGPFTQGFARESWMENLRGGLMQLNTELGISGDGITVEFELLEQLEDFRMPIQRWGVNQALEYIRRIYQDLYAAY